MTSESGWIETCGEVELIGGFAEVVLAPAFAALLGDEDLYEVFVSSYDPVPVFVANRTADKFEIHCMPRPGRRPSRTRCAYLAMAPAHPEPSTAGSIG